MYSFDLLHLIYHFPHHDLPSSQDEMSCHEIAKIFSDFCNSYSENDKLIVPSCGYTQEAMKEAAEFLTGKPPRSMHGYETPKINWFPEYGCAILYRTCLGQRRGFVGIDVIGLDNHEHEVHVGKSEYQFSARATSFATKYVGDIKVADYQSFHDRFVLLFSKGSKRHGDDRSAANGNQGHQKTPAWIHAIALQALKCKCQDFQKHCGCTQELSKGGFTDVGLHTGGLLRDTIFALVRSVFHNILECNQDCSRTKINFDVLMVEFYFYLTNIIILQKDITSVDMSFLMFQRCALEAAPLADDGYNIHSLRVRLQELKDTLYSTVSAEEQEKCRQSLLNTEIYSHRPPSLSIPDRVCPIQGEVKSDDEIQKLIRENIGNLRPLRDPSNIQEAYSWANELVNEYTKNPTSSVYFLRQVEKVFWNLGRERLSADEPLPISDLKLVYSLVQRYKHILHYGIRESEQKDGFQEVEARMKSIELLVVWMAYCVTFQSLRRHHPDIFDGFAVSLQYQDLKHLLIELPEQLEAMKSVSFFLQKHYDPKMGIFTRRSEKCSNENWNSPTFSMGQRYSRKFLSHLLEKGKFDADERIQKHWDEVCDKKDTVQTIRRNIERLEAEYLDAKKDYSNSGSDWKYWKSLMDLAGREWKTEEKKLRHALQAPNPVIQPLPKDENKALTLLFFLHMPDEFQILSELSFIAQQMLVPKPWQCKCGGSDGTELVDVFKTLAIKSEFYSWHNHYDSHTSPKPPKSVQTSLKLSRRTNQVPKQIGPSSVDNIHDRNDGIWYPDESGIRLSWFGGSNHWESTKQEFNPFEIKDSFTASYFTEILHDHDDFKNLQWSLVMQKETENMPRHGNKPYSSLCSAPLWLNKEGYCDFTSIRRYPLTALRSLCNALNRDSMPLHEISVGKLVRQNLFHVGNLSILNEELIMEWRLDYADIHDALSSILQKLTDTYIQRPSNYRACCILAEICGYLIAHSPYSFCLSKLLEIRNSLAQQMLNWALEYGEKARNASPDVVSSLRSKQTIFFRSAIFCAIHGHMDVTALTVIVESVVGARNTFVHNDDNKKERLQLKSLTEYFMGNKILEYVSKLQKNTDILTTALRTVIQSAPSEITWSEHDDSIATFSGTKDGHHYSINAYSGVVLIDGLPPKQLPMSITNDKSFKKCFGSNNFEVVLKKDHYETTYPIENCFYRFYKRNDKLVVLESPTVKPGQNLQWSEALELLQTGEVEDWGTDLPLYLKSAFSHWFSRKNHVLLFRDNYFGRRSPLFVHDMSKCFEIPIHEQSSFDLSQTQPETLQELIMLDSPVFKCLERLDDVQMIHSFRSDDGLLKISFLRFGLDFTLDGRKLRCNQIQGYSLRPEQHMAGFSPGFTQYLVLKAEQGDGIKIIVPFGSIQLVPPSSVKVDSERLYDDIHRVPGQSSVKKRLEYFIYDLHPRFQNLTGKSICSRLYLAALYLACNSLIPYQNSEGNTTFALTGEEKAFQVLRRCWINRPLSEEESYILNNLKAICKGQYPSIAILCHDLERCTSQVSFLNNNIAQETETWKMEEIHCEATAYYHMIGKPHSRRMLLTTSELSRTIGRFKHRAWNYSKPINVGRKEVNDFNLDTGIIKKLEDRLLKECHQKPQRKSGVPMFPLSISSQTNLEGFVEKELRESWKMYHHQLNIYLPRPKHSYEVVKEVHKIAAAIRLKVQNDLMDVLNFGSCMEEVNDHHTDGHHMLKLANFIPTATLIDLAAIALNKALIHDFIPHLSTKSAVMVHKAVVYWLQLCVLEDKCYFLLGHEHDDNAFLQELQASREWCVMEHPYWLVFEAEQRIRIRPEQYTVANHLIHNMGNVVQLNMGLGKTRIVLPMLILYFCFRNENTYIPRLYILSTLLDEACEYYHEVLCASVLGRRLFLCPFRRDVELDSEKVELLLDMIDLCEREGGFIAVAPEHRLSLDLKVKELQIDNNPLGNHLKEALDKKWLDIFDEVDEILHHRFQLVYAMGEPLPLPQGDRRWNVVSGVLRVFENLKLPGRVNFERDPSHPEKFSEYVMTDKMNDMEFRTKLTELFLNSPPPSFDWLLKLNNAKRSEISEIISDQSRNPRTLELSTEHMEDVLMLRGLLAHDILLNCLKKRLRVDYGINPNGRKRLSVPFRGADLPSLRAEFSHPDCAIILTHLSYYYRGLKMDEVITAFRILLELGKGAKESIYGDWYDRSKKMKAEKSVDMPTVNQIDLSNSAQLEIIFEVYRMNPLTINFWLRSEVFPKELDAYPKRLSSNAWHLARNEDRKVIGFSGTNDNHFLIPLQIRQYLPWGTDHSVWQKLLATNGKMLDVIFQRTKHCTNFGNSLQDMKVFLSEYFTKGNNAHALIDAGAILAGTSPCDLAKFLMPKLKHLRGVTYFDDTMWKVMEPTGRILPKNISPLHERDTFVIFDEPRCRGVDMKLKEDAIAFITIGKDMRKDKFMQAAGRMRQLDRQQSLYIIGPNNIFEEIKNATRHDFCTSSLNACDVLNWVMKNTCDSLVKGISMWADNGLFFASENKANDAVLDDSNDLNTLYGKPISEKDLPEIVMGSKRFHLERTGGSMMDLADEIVDRVQHLGHGYTRVSSSGVDEECERELEREIEEEEEEEIELPSMIPFSEKDWDYSNVFTKSTAVEACPDCLQLSEALLKTFSSSSVARILWSEHIYGTKNFFYTIETKDPDSKIDNFLRIPNFCIRFPNKDMLLLSDREAQIFLMRRDDFNTNANVLFCHCEFEMQKPSRLRVGKRKVDYLDSKARCSLKLFNGECNYPKDEREELKSMLAIGHNLNPSENRNVTDCSGNPERLSVARGKYKDFELSDLERITMEIACEADFRNHL